METFSIYIIRYVYRIIYNGEKYVDSDIDTQNKPYTSKKTQRNDVSNYRPIALLLTLTELFENRSG